MKLKYRKLNMARGNWKSRMPKGRGWAKKRLSLKKSSAQTIQKAWRNRKRKQFGLNTRTTLANRRAIKSLKTTRETKVIEGVQATSANNYAGQFMRGVTVDNLGQDTNNTNITLRPLRGMIQGDRNQDRTGNEVILRSVTFKFDVQAPTAALAAITEEYNEVTVLILLDTAPNSVSAPSVGGNTSGAVLTGPSPNPHSKYYLLKNVGKTKRFRPLYKKTVRIAPVQGGVSGYLQSTPYPPFARWSHTIKAPYKLVYGTDVGLQTYPQNQELVALMYSDSAAIPHPTMYCYCRTRFVDP